EQQLMCDGTRTFIRWLTAVKGEPTGIYHDTKLDGTALETPPVAEDVKAGICPDCTKTEYRELCDYDIREPEVVPVPEEQSEPHLVNEQLADGTPYTINSLGTRNIAGAWVFYASEIVNLNFDVAV